jgi:hypothetical protein
MVLECDLVAGVTACNARIGSGSLSRTALATLIWFLPSNGLFPTENGDSGTCSAGLGSKRKRTRTNKSPLMAAEKLYRF